MARRLRANQRQISLAKSEISPRYYAGPNVNLGIAYRYDIEWLLEITVLAFRAPLQYGCITAEISCHDRGVWDGTVCCQTDECLGDP